MAELLVARLESICRRTARRAGATAVLRVAAIAVAAAGTAAAVDWLANPVRPAARLALLATVPLAAALAAWREVRRLPPRATPLRIALQIQRLHPELGSLLASGVDFAGQDLASGNRGSAELRREAVARATAELLRYDLEPLVARQPLRRAAAAAAAVAALLVAAAAVGPQAARLAAVRLSNPWNAARWPLRHELQFVDAPERLLAGDEFRATLRDPRGRLLPEVEVAFWFDGDAAPVRQRYAAGSSALSVVQPRTSGSFRYRAEGGDDRQMAWKHVRVFARPRVESWELAIQPAPYTARPPHAADSQNVPEIVAGSELRWSGRCSVPLQAARLTPPGAEPLTCRLDAEGRRLTSERGWRAEQGGPLRLELATRDGLSTAVELPNPLRVVADACPAATLAGPRSDAPVTRAGTVRWEIRASDDQGLRQIELGWSSDAAAAPESPLDAASPTRSRALWPQPPQPPGPAAVALAATCAVAELEPEGQSVLLLRIRAEDQAGQWSAWSPAVRLRVVDDRQLRQELDERLETLAATLARLRAAQDSVGEGLSDEQAPRGGPFPSGVELRAALRRQQAVAAAVAEGPASATAQIRTWLDDAAANGLQAAAAWPLLEDAARQFTQLRQGPFEEAETALQAALRGALLSADRPLDAQPSTLAGWQAADRQIVATLAFWQEQLLGQVGDRRARAALAELAAAQRALRDAAAGRAARSRGEEDAGGDDDARRYAAEQRRLADGLRDWLAASETAQRRQGGVSPRAAVAAWARQRDATAVLEEAARQFDRRQWDDVTAAQRQAVETLDGMMHRWDVESTAEPSAPGPGAAQAAAAARQREWQLLAAAAPRLADRQLGICAALGPMAASDLAAWAALQAEIRGQAVSLAETLAAFPVGRAALEGAARAMADAQRHAFAERRGDRAARAAESALEQLQLIVQVVEASATLPQEPPAEASADGASLPAADRGEREGGAWTAIELRLLLALQERLREATWRWERGVADGTLTPAEAAAEAARLAAEQRRLTQLASGGAPPLD